MVKQLLAWMFREWKIVLFSLVYVWGVVNFQWSTFSITWPIEEYERRYANSQYVLGNARTEVLGDGDIYTYAGIRYIQGEDVTTINFEHTPLVKYMYGLSYVVSGRPNWILVPLIVIAIGVFWELSKVLIVPTWGRLLALGLFLGHSAMYANMSQTLLDFPMTVLLLITTLFFVRMVKSKTLLSAVYLGILVGLFLLAKYPAPLSILYAMLLYGYLVYVGCDIKRVIVSMSAVVVTYVLGYASYFWHGHSLLDFLKFEWWRWGWFSSKTDNPKWMIWQTLFTGRYPKWWDYSGTYVIIEYWNILWPISFSLYLLSWIYSFGQKQNLLFPYQLWVIISMAVYTLGAAEDRFLVPLIPGMALFGAAAVVQLTPRLVSCAQRYLPGIMDA